MFFVFFLKKKVRQNLSTWDLVLKISTREIQNGSRFGRTVYEIERFEVKESTKKEKTHRLLQVAHAVRQLS